MQTGMLVESHLSRLLLCILFLVSFIHLCLGAPGFPGTEGEGSHSSAPALANPFSSGGEDRRLLQMFIQASVTNGPGGPEIITREQEVFYMFGLYDYDHGGFLDGLELMKLVSEYNHHHSPGAQSTEQVVAMVDFLLQTQDLNQDGLLTPLELLSPPLPHSQEQGVAVEDKLPNLGADENTAGAETIEHGQLVHEEYKPQDEDLPQQEVKPQEEKFMHLEEQQIPEAQAAETGQVHQIPVHQGQPEI